jgi:PAS domain S-box-containing protein
MKTSCVSCHNSHPDSPKKDWKEGDLRGVLEFIRPIDNYGIVAIAQKRTDLKKTFAITGTMCGFGLLGLGLIIRRLRHTTESLHQSEESVRAMIDASHDAVVSFDQSGQITMWNPKAEIIFGWMENEAIEQDFFRTTLSRHYRETHHHEIQDFLSNGRSSLFNKRLEVAGLHRDGHELSLEISVIPLKKTKTTFSFVAFICDISERKKAEIELLKAHKQLLEISHQAGMAEVATGVLHNVGNALNSVNVSSTIASDNLKQSKLSNLSKPIALMREHEKDLGVFLSQDTKGKQLPEYLSQVTNLLLKEQTHTLYELDQLQKNIGHIKDIVATQQEYAKVSGVTETVSVRDLVEDALRMNANALVRHDVSVVREFADVSPLTIEKHKVLQILVNLIRNAKYACDESNKTNKQMTLSITQKGDRIQIGVKDNGVGIPMENLTKIFNHGFTTRKEGHGFGLHSGALAAKDLGGSLMAFSDGPLQGATFILELPVCL